jgi:hypothetical protein
LQAFVIFARVAIVAARSFGDYAGLFLKNRCHGGGFSQDFAKSRNWHAGCTL